MTPGPTTKPIILLVFANDRSPDGKYQRNLPEERRQLVDRLRPLQKRELVDVEVLPNATVDELTAALLRHAGRLAVIHYGGHANGNTWQLQSTQGDAAAADVAGLAGLLGQQPGLKLVFLNGCGTEPQVETLLAQGIPAVIATATAVSDEVALFFAAEFYAALAEGGSLEGAYRHAVDAGRVRYGMPGNTYRGMREVASVAADRWPWSLRISDGADDVKNWNLPQAAGNFLFGLPEPPPLPLPERPYQEALNWYTCEQAELFFGRGRQIRDLFQRLSAKDSSPVVLLYGQSGVGKSSLLDAGLLPRLRRKCAVRYGRRDRLLGARATLCVALGVQPEADDTALLDAWKAQEATDKRPLVILLDQVEEIFTRPIAGQPQELAALAATTAATFRLPATRPQGHLLLSFRKEFLPDIEQPLSKLAVDRSYVYLERLDHDSIVEVVRGPTDSRRLRTKYNLTVDNELPDVIAQDLTSDPASPVATVLHILLTEMWQAAEQRSKSAPRFDLDLYNELRRRGILLQDFFDQRVQEFQRAQGEIVTSGLLFDLLAFHTSPQGAAEERSAAQLIHEYRHREDLQEVVRTAKELRLLSDPASQAGEAGAKPGARLAHDTLAPIVRLAFLESSWPGQRARRVLESRMALWTSAQARPNDKAHPNGDLVLDDVDLALVEQGVQGMRAFTDEEQSLVTASKTKRDAERKRARMWRIIGGLAVGAIALLAVTALIFSQVARYQQSIAEQNAEDAKQSAQAAEEQRNAAIAAQQAAEDNAREAERQRIAAEGAQASAEENLAEARRQQLIAEGNARRSKASELVTYVQDELAQDTFDPSLALLLAEAAVSTTWLHDGYVTTNGDTALQQAIDRVQAVGWQMTLPAHQHSGPVNSVAFSPDGVSVLSASADQSARTWDVRTGKQMQLLTGHVGPVIAAAYAPDQSWLVTGGDDGELRLWKGSSELPPTTLYRGDSWIRSLAVHPERQVVAAGLDSGDVVIIEGLAAGTIFTLTGHLAKVNAVAFSPDGSRLLSAGADGIVRLWDAETHEGIGILPGHTGEVRFIGETPAGSVISLGADGNVKFWDATLGREIGDWETGKTGIRSASLNSSRTQLATTHDDGTVYLWDIDRQREITALRGHFGPVLSAAFSPDGKLLASGGEDGSMRLWDLVRRKELAQLHGHIGDVRSAAFSPDETLLVTTGQDGATRVWDTERGTVKYLLAGSEAMTLVRFASFGPDGKIIAITQDDGTVTLWTPETNKIAPCLPASGQAMRSVAFSADGSRLLVAGDDTVVRLLSASDCSVAKELVGHTGKIRSAFFNRDETKVVSASEDGTARVWDISASDQAEQILPHPDWVMYAGFSPDGKYVVTGSRDRAARIWEVATGQMVRELTGHAGFVRTVQYSPDGKLILTADEDGTAWLWNAASGQRLRKLLGHEDLVRFATFSPSGNSIATTGDDSTVRIWRLAPASVPRVMRGHTDMVRSAAYSPDGKTVATSSVDGTIRLWDSERGQQTQKLDGEGHTIWVVAFSLDGKFVFGGCDDGVLRIWNPAQVQPIRRIKASSDAILSIAFSADGKRFATAGKDRIARVWDAATFSTIRTFDEGTGTIWSVAFSPDGRQLATAGEYGGLAIWDVNSSQSLRTYEDKSSWIWGIAFNTAGTRLAVAGKDGRIRVLDANTGALVRELAGHTGLASSVMFLPDGKRLVSGGEDGFVRFWDLETGRQLRQLGGHAGPVWSIGLSPDRRRLISTSLDQTARIWDVEIDDMLQAAESAVQRDPPLLSVAEQQIYGLGPDPFVP